ncbi:Alpha/beta hydrolase fold-containing protein 2 [Elsinoe fawcettii]|nr:Alpha/beta hydrolase fold-containing protein 2 [Elsinoe fawcettii]
MPRSTWMLTLQARVMRFLMSIGMFIHKLLPPRPPSLAFTRIVPSTLSSIPGAFSVSIYTPPGYDICRGSSFKQNGRPHRYPCIINFHGGGFTLGSSTDDARFMRHAINTLACVVISVDYRLAPEYPFPTAVDDGADAVLWAAEHADELGIDTSSLILSGFSSGGNLTLSVPIRLHDDLHSISRQLYTTSYPTTSKRTSMTIAPVDAAASSSSLPSTMESIPLKSPSPVPRSRGRAPSAEFQIRALCPFYPSTNYALPRSIRRATNPNPAVDLPHNLTRLFDESYIPSSSIRLENPYLSPGLLSKAEMREVYAGMRILGVGCEFDMLCREGGDAMARIAAARRGEEDGEENEVGEEEGRTRVRVEEEGVSWRVVKGVRHGWDKRPFLSGQDRVAIEGEYAWVCQGVGEVLDGDSGGSRSVGTSGPDAS